MGFNTYPCSPFPPSTADMEKGDVTEQQKALIATIPGKAQKADIAPEFSTETAYNTGDLVYYNGALYEFTADHAAGAWSTDDTQAATIGGELDQLKSGLIDVNSNLTNLIKSGSISITILANSTTGTGYLNDGVIVPRSRIIGIIVNKNDDFYYYPVVFSVLENGTIELRMAVETSTTDRTYSIKVVYV